MSTSSKNVQYSLQNTLAASNLLGSWVNQRVVVDVAFSSRPNNDFDRGRHGVVTVEQIRG